MADYLLGSAGDDVKLWDVREYSLVKQYNPHSGRVSSLCWANDNSCLASASTAGDKIFINYPNNASYSYEIAIEEKKSSIAFNSMSRYVMGGGTDGLVHIWDLKSKKLKMTYKDHKAAVTSIQFNWNDTMIASGSESGEIILFSVVTGIGYSPLVVPREQAVRQVQYHHFKKSLLGSASDDGAINLWDTSSKRLLHSFVRAHKSPAMGLAFSPLNEMLMMSVGLDKRIVCYDVLGKCAVKTMSAESPLTSIDLMPDGATLAVGSTGGKVFIYDLRQGATPVKVLAAHSSSVQSLKFQHGAKPAKSEVGGMAKSTSITSIKPTKQETNINNVNNNPSQNTRDIPNSVSAVRSLPNLANHPRGEVANGRSPGYSYSSSHNVMSAGQDASPVRGGRTYKRRSFTTKGYKIDEMFSPLAENDSVSRHSHGGGESNGTSPVTGPIGTGFTTEEERLYGFDTMINVVNDMDMKSRPLQDSGPQSMASSMTTSSSREFDLAVDDLPIQDQPESASFSRAPNSSQNVNARPLYSELRNQHVESRAQRTEPTTDETYSFTAGSHYSLGSSTGSTPAFDHRPSKAYNSSKDNHHSRSILTNSSKPSEASKSNVHFPSTTTPPEAGPSEGAVGGATVSASGGATGPPLQSFHTEFIRNVVEDALDDFRDQIRQDILNLHTEVLKQFLVQQAEVERMVRQYSINEELLAEVERLKEENRRLKKKF